MTSLHQFNRSLFLIGCGNMAGAMLTRWLDCGLRPDLVTVTRPSGRPVATDIAVLTRFPSRLEDGALVILGMKPQQLPEVSRQIGALWRDDLTLISLLAGISTERLASDIGSVSVDEIIRVMPNTPVALGKGVCALFARNSVTAERKSAVETLLDPLGLVEWLKEERAFNLVTAVAGCGPAYLFRFIDALAGAAQALGMEEGAARRLSLAVVEGASALAARSGEDPGALADRVASKGGMTREGLDVLDADDRLKQLLMDVLCAARDRGEALGRMSG